MPYLVTIKSTTNIETDDVRMFLWLYGFILNLVVVISAYEHTCASALNYIYFHNFNSYNS